MMTTPKALQASCAGQFEIEDVGNWTNYLEENGYVVIKKVANENECSASIGMMWDFLESMPGGEKFVVRRTDSSTWRNQAWFPSSSYGLANGYGFGQSKFLWQARLLPKVETVFKTIWGQDKELIVSFDGGNVFRFV